MVKTLVTALALCLTLSGCGMFGADKPAPAPVAQVQPEPTPPPPPPPPVPLTHALKKGETIASVAKKYGVPASQLLAANNLRSAKGVRSGTVLTIPNKFVSPESCNVPPAKEKAVQEKEVKPVKGSKADPYGVEAATKPEKGKKKVFKLDDEATYEKIKTDFHEYAAKWLQKEQTLAEANKNHKTVTMEDGHYVASYGVIQFNTMQTEVKRVDYDDTPYVGHITYVMEVHRTTGPTAQAAMATQNEEVKQECMREIFSYSRQKHAWR